MHSFRTKRITYTLHASKFTDFLRINYLLLKLPVSSEEPCGLYAIKSWKVLVCNCSCYFQKKQVPTQCVCFGMKEGGIFSRGEEGAPPPPSTVSFLCPEKCSFCSECRFLVLSLLIILSVKAKVR
jgi:hypothetical protein